MVTPTIPSGEPKSFVRGDSCKWTRGFSEYLPADGWTLTYYIVSSNGKKSIVATDNGDGSFLATLTTTISLSMAEGVWTWQAVLTKTGERKTLDSGTFVVEQNFDNVGQSYDSRTFARKMLDAIEALLLDTSGSDETSISIDGVSTSFENKAELIAARDRFKREVKQEEQAANLKKGLGGSVRVRF